MVEHYTFFIFLLRTKNFFTWSRDKSVCPLLPQLNKKRAPVADGNTWKPDEKDRNFWFFSFNASLGWKDWTISESLQRRWVVQDKRWSEKKVTDSGFPQKEIEWLSRKKGLLIFFFSLRYSVTKSIIFRSLLVLQQRPQCVQQGPRERKKSFLGFLIGFCLHRESVVLAPLFSHEIILEPLIIAGLQKCVNLGLDETSGWRCKTHAHTISDRNSAGYWCKKWNHILLRIFSLYCC